MKFLRSSKPSEASAAEPAPPESPPESQRLCPQCGAIIAARARTCLNCGTDLVAIARAEKAQAKAIERELRAEAAQRPTRIIVIIFTALIILVFVAIIVQSTRQAAIVALTPTVTRAATRPVLPTATPRPSATPTGTPTPPPPLEYEVKNGDTPGRIALLYDVSLEALMAFNAKATDDLIVVGEVLKIPPPTPRPTEPGVPAVISPTPSGANEIVYIVQAGDTLGAIALTYDTTIDEIQARNNLPNIQELHIGDKLIIPVEPTPTVTRGPGTAAAAAATATPVAQYAPVTLLTPLAQEIFIGNNSPILLQWLSTGLLQPNELYLVEVERPGAGRLVSFRTRATSFHLLPDQFPAPAEPNRLFKWRVMIIRQAGAGSDNAPTYRVISPASESTFEWLETLPTPTPTATPRPGSRPAVQPTDTPAPTLTPTP
jgi:LysM repeat protein